MDLQYPEESSSVQPPPLSSVDFNFRPIKIIVYKNGEGMEEGRVVMVTRREFKHWLVFLDGLTRRLNTHTAVHRLYDTQGHRINNFEELRHGGEYVAVEKLPFIHCNYGSHRENLPCSKMFAVQWNVPEPQASFLESAESMDIYMRKHGYGSISGLPYPLDAILLKSPSYSHVRDDSNQDIEELKSLPPSTIARQLVEEVVEEVAKQMEGEEGERRERERRETEKGDRESREAGKVGGEEEQEERLLPPVTEKRGRREERIGQGKEMLNEAHTLSHKHTLLPVMTSSSTKTAPRSSARKSLITLPPVQSTSVRNGETEKEDSRRTEQKTERGKASPSLVPILKTSRREEPAKNESKRGGNGNEVAASLPPLERKSLPSLQEMKTKDFLDDMSTPLLSFRTKVWGGSERHLSTFSSEIHEEDVDIPSFARLRSLSHRLGDSAILFCRHFHDVRCLCRHRRHYVHGPHHHQFDPDFDF